MTVEMSHKVMWYLKAFTATWWIYVYDLDVLSCEKIGSDLAATSAGISSKS